MPEQAEPGSPEPPRRPDRLQHGSGRSSRLPGINPRTWSGRPITLAIGWLMSCALVTAVTLTAVERVGHEISGSQPPVLSNQQVAQAAGQASVSASAASAEAGHHPSPASSTPPATSPAATAHPSVTPPPRRTTPPAATLTPGSATPPASAPSAQTSASTASPPPSASASGSPSGSTSSSPTASPSGTTSPTGSPSTSKTVEYWWPDPAPAPYRGRIIFTCSGDTIVNATAGLWQPPDQTYTMTDNSTPGKMLDVTFSKGGVSTEYVYTCSAGTAVGGPVTPEHS